MLILLLHSRAVTTGCPYLPLSNGKMGRTGLKAHANRMLVSECLLTASREDEHHQFNPKQNGRTEKSRLIS